MVKSTVFHLWMLSAAIVAAVVPIAAQDCRIPLRGVVTDAHTGEPLPYATVWVHEVARAVLSDDQGRFLMPDLCRGTAYTVEVRHIGCVHQTQVVELQASTVLSFALAHDALLPQVVVSERALTPVSMQPESRVGKEDLAGAQGLNLSETLRRLPGVSSLQTGSTIAKPVIQGLHSNRIAIVQNNLAIEGQQWGSEHAPEVDPFTASTISVVKGAAAVRYGVGAMAGAVVMEPEPLRRADGWGGWLSLGGFSNGRMGVLSGSVDHRLPGTGLAFRLQGTAKRGGNLRAPDYWLGNTGVAEFNLSGVAGWKTGRWEHTVNLSRVDQQFGILRAAHLGNLTDLELAIQADTPRNNRNVFDYAVERPYQDVQHHVAQYRFTRLLSDIWRIKGQYGMQYNRRREFDVVRGASSAASKPQQTFWLYTHTLDASVEHLPVQYWQGGAGVQVLYQDNQVGRGGLIPDFTSFGTSVWAMERYRRYPSPWAFEAGLRYDYRTSDVAPVVNLTLLDTTVRFGNLSGTVGVAYHLGDALRVQLNSGYAWRPPTVYELFARGVHHGTATYEQGRPDLQTERSWNTQLHVDYEKGKRHASLTVFRNRAMDFIYLDPQQTFVLTIRGAFPAYFYAQSDAVLQGVDAQVDWPVWGGLSVEGRASILRGYRLGLDSAEASTRRDWLPLMPADRYQFGIRYDFQASNLGQTRFIRLQATRVLRQERVPEAGLLKAPPPGATFLTLDAGYALTIGRQPVELGIMVQNLTNVRYREYMNFFRFFADEPGFNAGIRARWTFG